MLCSWNGPGQSHFKFSHNLGDWDSLVNFGQHDFGLSVFSEKMGHKIGIIILFLNYPKFGLQKIDGIKWNILIFTP